MEAFTEAVHQLRAILDVQSLALSFHRLGQTIPLLKPHQPEIWFLNKLDATLKVLFEDLEGHIEDATARQLMQIFWGASRLGASGLNPDAEKLMKRVMQWLLEANEFGGNHACSMIEAVSNFSFPLKQPTLDFILRDAVHDFILPTTSPFNILYFLNAAAKRELQIPKQIISAGLKNVVFHFDLLRMHHVASLISSLAVLQFQNIHEVLHVIRERTEITSWLYQPMWKDDFVKLTQSLSQLPVDPIEVRPIFAKLDRHARRHGPRFDPHQIEQITQACQSVGVTHFKVYY